LSLLDCTPLEHLGNSGHALPKGEKTMYSHRIVAKTFGVFFILTFLSYGVGTSLIDAIINTPDFLSHVYAEKTTLVIGIILTGLVHSFMNIGLPVIMLPILKPYNEHLTYGYLCAAFLATTILAVGSIFSLLLLPLSEEYAKADVTQAQTIETVGYLLKEGGYYSYHMGMAMWSIGGLMLVALLYESNLIPRTLSAGGFIGYLFLVTGSTMALFQQSNVVEVVSVIPGGLFEITLSIWLIIKGFNTSAIALDVVLINA
jgi:hypothetical protein